MYNLIQHVGRFRAGNLATLGIFMATHNDALLDAGQFDMASFCRPIGSPGGSRGPEKMVNAKPGHDCGAIACAVGWSPAAGIAPLSIDMSRGATLDWSIYAETNLIPAGRVLPGPENSPRNDNSMVTTWWFDTLFGGHWSEADNRPIAVAARIALLDLHAERIDYRCNSSNLLMEAGEHATFFNSDDEDWETPIEFDRDKLIEHLQQLQAFANHPE